MTHVRSAVKKSCYPNDQNTIVPFAIKLEKITLLLTNLNELRKI